LVSDPHLAPPDWDPWGGPPPSPAMRARDAGCTAAKPSPALHCGRGGPSPPGWVDEGLAGVWPLRTGSNAFPSAENVPGPSQVSWGNRIRTPTRLASVGLGSTSSPGGVRACFHRARRITRQDCDLRRRREGTVQWQGKVPSEPGPLVRRLAEWSGVIKFAGIEACPLS
jgi:hypothetical protein